MRAFGARAPLAESPAWRLAHRRPRPRGAPHGRKLPELEAHLCATFRYASTETEAQRRVRIGKSIVRLIMTHGYMLSGTGSNVYVQNLCRGLVREGHEVHLLCQEPKPLAYDFVNECSTVDASDVEKQGEQGTP